MTFKLSSETIQVIKNFSLINAGMVFNPGKVLQTLEPTKSILAFAQIEEEIPAEFAVSDLSRFLGALSMHNPASLELNIVPDKYIEFTSDGGTRKTTYRMTDKSNVVYPLKKLTMPTPDAEVKLTADQISSIISDAASLGLPHVVFKGNQVVLTDVKNDASDSHTVDLPELKASNFTAVFKIENFSKLLKNANYTMQLSEKKISHFVSEKVEYFIALEKWN